MLVRAEDDQRRATRLAHGLLVQIAQRALDTLGGFDIEYGHVDGALNISVVLRHGKDGLVAREDHVRGQLAAHVPQPPGICVRHAPLDLELGPKKLCAPRAARAAREFRRPAIRKRGVQQPL